MFNWFKKKPEVDSANTTPDAFTSRDLIGYQRMLREQERIERTARIAKTRVERADQLKECKQTILDAVAKKEHRAIYRPLGDDRYTCELLSEVLLADGFFGIINRAGEKWFLTILGWQ